MIEYLLKLHEYKSVAWGVNLVEVERLAVVTRSAWCIAVRSSHFGYLCTGHVRYKV